HTSPSAQRYCAQYLYPSSSTGYGCGLVNGFIASVLLITTGVGTQLQATPLTILPSTTTSSSTNRPTSTAGLNSNSNTNSKAGIIAGATLGGVAFLAALFTTIWFLVHRYRKIKRGEAGVGAEPKPQIAPAAELPGPDLEPRKDNT